jgi:hypothetical protein
LADTGPARTIDELPNQTPEDRPVSRLSLAPNRHDPYWDLDGANAQRHRTKQRVIRAAAWFVILVALGFTATLLPSIDPEFLLRGEGRPVMAAALFGLLGAAAILALARIRNTSQN